MKRPEWLKPDWSAEDDCILDENGEPVDALDLLQAME